MSSGSELAWFKSSYSGSSGDDCVEVAWFKSSYSSGSGDSCVEVAGSPGTVHVRDSKVAGGPEVSIHAPAWASFVNFVANGT